MKHSPNEIYHRLSNINPDAGTVTCAVCGPTTMYVYNRGKPNATYQCLNKRLQVRKASDKRYRKNHKLERAKQCRPYRFMVDCSKCSLCGFIPEDSCQIDVDHINGNHHDNDKSNLQALCANCHRLKTKRDKAFISTLAHNKQIS